MKYLSNYTENLQTDLFKSTGAFFAFSTEQLEEQRKADIKYVSLGSGMICPKSNVNALIDGLDSINTNGIAADIAENGLKAIIHRELGNHEAQITGDISDTVDVLTDYPGITFEAVQAEYPAFYQNCVDNDYF